MNIVILSGKAGSGKSTTADQLAIAARESGKYYFIFPFKFAGPLYEVQDLVLNHMEKVLGKPRSKKDRVLLQLLGTEWGRKVLGENVWVDALRKKITEETKAWKQEKVLIIIDDCRFENEFDGFPEALRVRLECAEYIRKERAQAWPENTLHPSETGLDQYYDRDLFDLTIATDDQDVTAYSCAKVVIQKLLAGDWVAKRG